MQRGFSVKNANRIPYLGGKMRLLEWIIPFVPTRATVAVEPFGGVGAFSQVFATTNRFEQIIYSESGGLLVNLLRSIRDDRGELQRKLTTPVDRTIYDFCRQQFNLDDRRISDVERAWRLLVALNHGIYGGRGKGQNTGFRPRKRFRAMAEHLPMLSWLLKRFDILHGDAFELLVQPELNDRNVFWFLDPPYVREERKRNDWDYPSELTHEQHERLCDICNASEAKIILCGYRNAIYDRKLKDWHRHQIKEYRHGKEHIWFNYDPPAQSRFALDLPEELQ